MGRHQGHKKTGGRTKGTLNKRSEELLFLLNKHSYNPVESILKKYPTLSASEQLKIDLKLLEHVYPKLKEQPLEVEQEFSEIENLTDQDLKNLKTHYRKVLKSDYKDTCLATSELEMIHEKNPNAVNDWIVKNQSKAPFFSKVEK